jgi:general secretion pathway protein E
MLELRPAHELLPLARALARHCALLRGEDATLVAVVPDPFDVELQDWIAAVAREPVKPRLALRADIQAYLTKLEGSARAMDAVELSLIQQAEGGEAGEQISIQRIHEDESEAVKIVNSTLYDAIRDGASDIHLRSARDGMVIKHRIDGVLGSAGPTFPREVSTRIISRLKVLAELDIAEQRLPQDGRLALRLAGRAVDLRVSIMPGIHGEDAVLRVLDRQQLDGGSGQLAVRRLGLAARDAQFARRMAALPYGLFLVTGPTGSGKTTTLYALLAETHDGLQKIITIEDPVEYELPGVLQIPVNEAKGLTFARGLRSVLRHDPDRIMVGEIRDPETAQIALQAALTGHQVYATVHANNAVDVIGRLASMGVDPYNLAAALNGVLAQRLVRTVCGHCATEHQPDEDELSELGLTRRDLVGRVLRRGTGCGDCRATGYKGRRAIVEILPLDDTLRRMIAEKQPIADIKERARASGTRFLRDAALELAFQGRRRSKRWRVSLFRRERVYASIELDRIALVRLGADGAPREHAVVPWELIPERPEDALRMLGSTLPGDVRPACRRMGDRHRRAAFGAALLGVRGARAAARTAAPDHCRALQSALASPLPHRRARAACTAPAHALLAGGRRARLRHLRGARRRRLHRSARARDPAAYGDRHRRGPRTRASARRRHRARRAGPPGGRHRGRCPGRGDAARRCTRLGRAGAGLVPRLPAGIGGTLGMRAPRIEFAPAPRTRQLLRAALLFAALAFGAAMLWRSLSAASALEQVEQRIQAANEALERLRSARPVDAEPPIAPARLNAINNTIARLNVPWSELFAAFETDRPQDVALLALLPDARKRSLVVQAEATNPRAMVAFVERLRSVPLFDDAFLLKHERREQEPGQPYRFAVEVRWKDVP